MAIRDVVARFNNERYATDDDMDCSCSNHYLRYQAITDIVRAWLTGKNAQSCRLVDVGCGPGHLAAQLITTGASVWGIDVSINALNLAAAKGVTTVTANLDEPFPLEDASFDIVVATEVIEHIYDTEQFIDELRRILRPDGLLIITTPNVASLARRFMLLFGLNPFLDYKLSSGAGHIRYFTFTDMTSFLQDHGFTVLTKATDAINLSISGRVYSRLAGRWLPKLGRCIIMTAKIS